MTLSCELPTELGWANLGDQKVNFYGLKWWPLKIGGPVRLHTWNMHKQWSNYGVGRGGLAREKTRWPPRNTWFERAQGGLPLQ